MVLGWWCRTYVLPDGSNRPIAYASQTLNSLQQNYSQFDKKALAIIFSLERFRLCLYGRQFTIQSDHKPLQHILGLKSAVPTLAAHAAFAKMGDHLVSFSV